MTSEPPARRIDDISTRWSAVADMNQFVLRYTPAMQSYLCAILKDDDLARDVLQDFLTKVIERGFGVDETRRGRFRDFLTKSVKNAAISFLRKRTTSTMDPALLSNIESRTSQDDDWTRVWTQGLLDRAWRKLEDHQLSTPENLYFTVLQFATENSATKSSAAAAALSTPERALTAASYRQQLRRARVMFADLLRAEVAETLSSDAPEDLEEELQSLGLMTNVKWALRSVHSLSGR